MLRAYTKAWNAKIVPIFLTVVSTILGFIPFMVGTEKEAFWFPLARIVMVYLFLLPRLIYNYAIIPLMILQGVVILLIGQRNIDVYKRQA